MNQHIMIDLETLGTNIDSIELTIGALKFTPHDYSDWQWGNFPIEQVFIEELIRTRLLLD